MKYRKAFIMVCFAIVFAGIFCACKNVTVSVQNGGTGNVKYKYTMNILNAETAGKGKDGKLAGNFEYFCKRFNIEFEFYPVTFSNIVEKCRIWIFSGDMPDILFMDVAPARFNEYTKAAKQGAFKPLPDLGLKYPNLQKYKYALRSTEYFTVNGKMYAWPRTRDAAEFNYASYWNYVYRKDWAEKLGMAKGDNIYTWDEWLALNKAFVEKDPGGNGSGKTVGMGGPSWALPKFMGGGCINPYFWTYAKVDGKYVWGPTMPQSLELVKTFKKMYDDGIIWKDMITAKGADAEERYHGGLMGAMPLNATVAVLANFRENFKKANPNIADIDKATQLALVRDKNGKIYADQTEDYWSCIAFNPTMDDDKFHRILSAYDWLASDEGYYFRTLGVPGLDWETKNGGITVKWAKNANGVLQYPYEKDGEHWMGVGLTERFDLQSPAYTEKLRNEITAVQKRKLEKDCNLVPFNYNVAFFSGPNYDKVGTMENRIIDKLCELLTSSKDIEKDWKAWLKEMEPIYKPVEEELNRGLAK